MNWSALRVLNEDIIAPLQGFDMHPHRDMEIISFIITGALQHKDSMGHQSIVRRGQFQYMSAGSGVLHSEFNPDSNVATRMLQIWIFPSEKSLRPHWEQKQWDQFSPSSNGLILLASYDGRQFSTKIQQDVDIWQVGHTQMTNYVLNLKQNRKGWLQIAEGEATLTASNSSIRLTAGDAVAVEHESELTLTEINSLNALWFDLPQDF